MADCTCTVTDPKPWTTYGSAVEPNPDCDAHFPDRPGCPECKVQSDHTWWCGIAPAILPDGTRPYYWRD